MSRALTIAMVAGESSGDQLGASLMAALRHAHPGPIHFVGIGGPRMIAAGFDSVFPQDRLAVMGLVEPLKRLPELLGIRRALRRRFTAEPPDLFLGIDSPDFNLGLERALRARGVITAHYVSPSVWAWRQGRIKGIAKAVDHMLCLLPFEARFYEQHAVPVTFVGHPLADDMPLTTDVAGARAELGIAPDAEVVALLPGSRRNEVALLGADFLAAAARCQQQRPNLEFWLPAAGPERHEQLQELLAAHPDLRVTVVTGQSHTVMAAADAVLMASGTTTLEAMLLKKPMVVAYRLAPLTFAIAKRLVKTPYVALPNLLAREALVPEILQDAVTPEALADALLAYFEQPQRAQALQARFTELHQQLRRDASATAARALLQLIEARP